MPKFDDLTGKRFGRLVAVARILDKRPTQWKWLCDCGRTAILPYGNVSRGRTKSCGCLQREMRGHCHETHGGVGEDLYSVWTGMKGRCWNPNNHKYHRYGGRGISICERWTDYAKFRDDMGERPSGAYSLDRIDNDGDYEPSNCRWANLSEQANNRSGNRRIEFNGDVKTVAEWSRFLGICYATLWHRINNNWSIDDAFSREIRKW